MKRQSIFILLVIAALFVGVVNPHATLAEEGKNAASAPANEAPAKTAALDETLSRIEGQKAAIQGLIQRRGEDTGRAREILDRRIDRANL